MRALRGTSENPLLRPRPDDGGMEWHHDINAFECLGCLDHISVRPSVYRDPEALLSMKELLVLDHTECWLYLDAAQARKARRFRKNSTRRKLLSAQKTVWRGAR